MLEHDLPYKDRARVYDIEPGEKGKRLVLTVPTTSAENVTEVLSRPDIPIVSDLRESLGLPKFINPKSEAWGFGPVIHNHKAESGEAAWVCSLPKYDKASEDDWTIPYATSATLQVTFMALGLLEEGSPRDKSQLIHIQLTTSRDMGGGAWVTLGASIVPWLSSLPDDYFHRGIQETMRAAHEHMLGRVGHASFRAWFRQPKWVNLDCPGNACGLDPEDYYDKGLNTGYRLFPHNVETPFQQLALLARIASMHKEARKAGY